MENKQYLIESIQQAVFSFNEYWEDPDTDSELVKDPEKTAELIISYCRLLQLQAKKYKAAFEKKDYKALPPEVQSNIQEIIKLVSDGRDLHHECFYKTVGRKFNHHLRDSGNLYFEDCCESLLGSLIGYCERLIEVVQSEGATIDLQKYVNKHLEWEHYEEGSYCIRIDSINKTKDGKFTFDGFITWFCTEDSCFEHNGILLDNVEDFPFTDLIFVREKDVKDEKALATFLDSGKEVSAEQLKQEVIEAMGNYFTQVYEGY